MRITGGLMRGRRLAAPKGREIRPTSDRVREAVFSMIGQDLEGFFIMDLFAGTGALGIEALSRGCRRALFVDNSFRALELIRRNLSLCALEKGARVIRWDLRRGLPEEALTPEGRFDLIFMDPPYGHNLASPIVESLGSSDLLGPNALVIVETASGETLQVTEGRMRLLDSRAYGDTKIHLLTRDWEQGSSTDNHSCAERTI